MVSHADNAGTRRSAGGRGTPGPCSCALGRSPGRSTSRTPADVRRCWPAYRGGHRRILRAPAARYRGRTDPNTTGTPRRGDYCSAPTSAVPARTGRYRPAGSGPRKTLPMPRVATRCQTLPNMPAPPSHRPPQPDRPGPQYPQSCHASAACCDAMPGADVDVTVAVTFAAPIRTRCQRPGPSPAEPTAPSGHRTDNPGANVVPPLRPAVQRPTHIFPPWRVGSRPLALPSAAPRGAPGHAPTDPTRNHR